MPGLSANLCGFDRLAERLAGDTLHLVAIDLRGRGRSEVTGAGTYGWCNQARDVASPGLWFAFIDTGLAG